MDMKGYYSVSWTKHMKESFFAAPHTRRQHQCIQENHVAPEQTSSLNHSLKLAASAATSQNTLPIMLHAFVALLLLLSPISPVLSHPNIASDSALSHSHPNATSTFRPALHKLRRIRTHLKKINKPALKTIKAFFIFALEAVTITFLLL